MTATAPAGTAVPTLPDWVAAQLMADWWSDPTDTATGTAGLPASVRPGERSDPAGPAALVAARSLGLTPAPLEALALAATDEHGLADDYELLFVGPGGSPCPPYESMWCDDEEGRPAASMGGAAREVLALYRTGGLTLPPHAGELADHVVVQWEAVAYCLDANRTVATTLVTQHLAAWMPRICAAVSTHATHPYYRALAELTPLWTTALAARLIRAAAEA